MTNNDMIKNNQLNLDDKINVIQLKNDKNDDDGVDGEIKQNKGKKKKKKKECC